MEQQEGLKRSARWVVPVLAGVLATLTTFPWVFRPWHVPGSPVVEADNHLWMLWRAGQGPGVWSNWPDGDPRPLLDVVHAPFGAVMAVDPAFAYGLVWWANALLAGVAGWWLAREAGASRAGAMVGLAVLATAPAAGGALVFGLTEAAPLGWLALYLAAALRAGRDGAPWAIWTGIVGLAGFALSGWYNAFFGLIAAAVALGWVAARRGALVPVLAQGVGAFVVVLPVFLAFLAHGDAEGLAARDPGAWVFRPDWRHAPDWGTDPLNLVLPSLHGTELARTAYLGVAAMVLGGSGRGRRGRRGSHGWGSGCSACSRSVTT